MRPFPRTSDFLPTWSREPDEPLWTGGADIYFQKQIILKNLIFLRLKGSHPFCHFLASCEPAKKRGNIKQVKTKINTFSWNPPFPFSASTLGLYLPGSSQGGFTNIEKRNIPSAEKIYRTLSLQACPRHSFSWRQPPSCPRRRTSSKWGTCPLPPPELGC